MISEAVCKAYDIPLLQLYSRRRDAGTVLPRHMAWALASRMTTHSYSAIGRLMGGRDHASVSHGVQRILGALNDDEQIAGNYQALVDAIAVIDAAGERSDRAGLRFNDIDPLEVAERILSAPFRDTLPSLEEVRALCFGVTHYAAELERLTDENPTPNNT
ncbi:UNVERIFIED_ORG: hypothetical protein LHK14_00345 [Roseateles sp. XES5]|nr:helix-turn-helix domain-containing protein [Roseateles sp. XES5]